MPPSPLYTRHVHGPFDSCDCGGAVARCAMSGGERSGAPLASKLNLQLGRRCGGGTPPGRHRRIRSLMGRQSRRLWRVVMALLAMYLALYCGALDWLPLQRRGFVRGELDVVSVAVKPTCINRVALAAVRKYLRPRTIHVVTAMQPQCDIFESWAPNIQCHLQDSFLPGVTRASVAAALEQHYGVKGGRRFKGRDLAGWYLQQFIKLGAAAALPGLSQHFVVWDADMIPLRPLRVFSVPPRRLGQGAPMQTVANIGGASAPGYGATYSKLFGMPLEAAPDGSSFVTHWMVVYQPYLQEFLSAVIGVNDSASSGGSDGSLGGAGSRLEAFVDAVLAVLPPGHLDMGFSEYASYVSWVRQHHPHSQRITHRRAWLRYGLGGETAIRLARVLSLSRLCCPPRSVLLWARLLG